MIRVIAAGRTRIRYRYIDGASRWTSDTLRISGRHFLRKDITMIEILTREREKERKRVSLRELIAISQPVEDKVARFRLAFDRDTC